MGTATEPEETTIASYGPRRRVWKLLYDQRLPQEEVARYELAPALPESVQPGDSYPLQLGKYRGTLHVLEVAPDRSQATVQAQWEPKKLDAETYSVRGLLKHYPKVFTPLVYPVEE